MEFKQTPIQQKKDLSNYISEGIYWAIMYYFGLAFLVPYLIYLKANTIQIGLLNVLPIFIASFFGLLSYDIVKYFKSEKHFVVFFTALQAFFWIPLALIGYLVKSPLVIWLVIIFYCIIMIMEQLPYPVYREWIGRVFDIKKIVEYTSRKQIIMNLIAIVPLFAAGFVMDVINQNNMLIGFTIIFVLAGLFRFGSVVVLNRMSQTENIEDIDKEAKEQSRPLFKVFKREVLKNKQFLYFLIIISLIFFGMYIAAPYYRYYFLEILKFTYKQYIFIEIGSILGLILSFYYWGKICDKYGATKVLKAIILFIPIYPLCIILFGKNIWLLFILNIYDGVLMAGLTLGIYGYLYQNIKQDMIHHVSFFMIFHSSAMLLGSIVGGIISSSSQLWLFGIEKNGLLLIFIISIIFRLITIGFVGKIKDTNKNKINLPKNILLQKPIIFGLTKFFNFTRHEGKVIAENLKTQENELKCALLDEEKAIRKEIVLLANKERKIFNNISKIEKKKTRKKAKNNQKLELTKAKDFRK